MIIHNILYTKKKNQQNAGRQSFESKYIAYYHIDKKKTCKLNLFIFKID